MPEPARPSHLSEYAEMTLAALAAAGLGHVISVGGGLGLLHYLDYRTTHDVFSFQIASRSAQLQPPTTLPWSDVALDSLPDLVASKMVALVERGAPRDFRDIYAVCRAGLMGPADCWSLWRQRQQKAGSDIDPHRARLAIETHLTRISQHRPLEAIADPDQRTEAEAVRSWFTQEFLHAHLD